MADKEFEQEFLDAHNAYRAMHGAPPLTYNSQMCNEAQKWAERCLHSQTLGHSETKDGENVFCKSGFPTVKITGKEAVDAWYSEIKDYTFTPPRFSPKTGKDVVDAWFNVIKDHNLEPSLFQDGTGHFSQVVWKNSKELGLGMATDGKKAFVIGLYRPPGNYVNAGQFETNVLPKVSE